MTINIGLLTNELVVFSCDSVASISRHYVDPFRFKWEESEGQIRITFRHSDITPLVTEAWGGVTKMFPLHDGPTPVAAVTSGLAKLNDRTMSSLAEDFHAKAASRTQQRVHVEVVARDFLRFMRTELAQHYEGTDVPEQFWQGAGVPGWRLWQRRSPPVAVPNPREREPA